MSSFSDVKLTLKISIGINCSPEPTSVSKVLSRLRVQLFFYLCDETLTQKMIWLTMTLNNRDNILSRIVTRLLNAQAQEQGRANCVAVIRTQHASGIREQHLHWFISHELGGLTGRFRVAQTEITKLYCLKCQSINKYLVSKNSLASIVQSHIVYRIMPFWIGLIKKVFL